MVVRSFSGATTECMEHYIMPTISQQPENIVLHVGTNDLKGVCKASKISERIVNLAMKCAENGSRVFVSGIVKRGDVLGGKAEAVNQILKASCQSRNIGFIDHNNIELGDLNGSKLHLNKTGSKKLTSNIVNFISKI